MEQKLSSKALIDRLVTNDRSNNASVGLTEIENSSRKRPDLSQHKVNHNNRDLIRVMDNQKLSQI